MEAFYDKFKKELDLLSIKLEKDQLEQFYKYYEILIEWNKVMNLTAITQMDEVVSKHFIDSLSLVKTVKDLGVRDYHIIDVGTGAGFPGIPLKIAFPQLHITLMDSLNKRINFLNEVIGQLNLENMVAIHGRAEDLGRDMNHREQYDLCVSRAVAHLSTLSEYCMPFVKIGGSFVSYKSGKLEEELTEAKHAIFLLGGKLERTEKFLLPGTDVERTFVQVIKTNAISKKYPRKAGLPSKEPLK